VIKPPINRSHRVGVDAVEKRNASAFPGKEPSQLRGRPNYYSDFDVL
jgi:hypothetical protein